MHGSQALGALGVAESGVVGQVLRVGDEGDRTSGDDGNGYRRDAYPLGGMSVLRAPTIGVVRLRVRTWHADHHVAHITAAADGFGPLTEEIRRCSAALRLEDTGGRHRRDEPGQPGAVHRVRFVPAEPTFSSTP